jgi:periplasmic divalent cation tolerance protein
MTVNDAAGGIVVLCTAPSADKAAEIARVLVSERLCACVTLLPAIRSIYQWKDAIADDAETLLVIKTRPERWEPLRARIVALHPYEVPEVIALPVAAGHAPYLDWITRETTAR